MITHDANFCGSLKVISRLFFYDVFARFQCWLLAFFFRDKILIFFQKKKREEKFT
ncbi:Lipid-A-disaccharide synthase [Psidium guajava]|nr:Lipid-A-disaccharide synthase [Psidium guajava]